MWASGGIRRWRKENKKVSFNFLGSEGYYFNMAWKSVPTTMRMIICHRKLFNYCMWVRGRVNVHCKCALFLCRVIDCV